jgi:hypothetical protein
MPCTTVCGVDLDILNGDVPGWEPEGGSMGDPKRTSRFTSVHFRRADRVGKAGGECDESFGDVTAVDNQITARPDFAAGATGERIGQALSRHAGREAHHTVVDARDGTVTLTGTIGAHAEHETARGAAWSTRSVHAVADNLEVESGR